MALIMGIESYLLARRKLRIRSTRTDAVYKITLVNYDDAIVVAGHPRGACEPPKAADGEGQCRRHNCLDSILYAWKSCVTEETTPTPYKHEFIRVSKWHDQ